MGGFVCEMGKSHWNGFLDVWCPLQPRTVSLQIALSYEESGSEKTTNQKAGILIRQSAKHASAC